MSVKIMTRIWENAPYSEGSLLVLLALADWSNDEGFSWPSVSRLAQKARLDKRQVQRILKQLSSDGVLVIQQGGGRGNQNVYQIKSDNMSPFINAERVTFETQRVTLATERVTPMSPDPLVEPSVDTSLSRKSAPPPVSNVTRFVNRRSRPQSNGYQKKPPTPERLPMVKGFRPVPEAVAQVEQRYEGIDTEEIILKWRAKRMSDGAVSADWNADFIYFASNYQQNVTERQNRYAERENVYR